MEGSYACLTAELGLGGAWVRVDEHRSDKTFLYNTGGVSSQGHGGGDFGLMAAFVQSVRDDLAESLTTARQSLESHLMAFAAEKARKEQRVMLRDEWLSE
jgi:hypothetical protein